MPPGLTLAHIMVGYFEIVPPSRERSSAQHTSYIVNSVKDTIIISRDFSVCGPELGARIRLPDKFLYMTSLIALQAGPQAVKENQR